MRVELGLALAGIRHRPGPWILLAAGVALATMLPLVAAGTAYGGRGRRGRGCVQECRRPPGPCWP